MLDKIKDLISNKGAVNTQTKTPHINPHRVIDKKMFRKLKKDGFDPDFIVRIQPQGGITWDDDHAIAGDGYSACLSIIHYPNDPHILWLTELALNESTVTTIDVDSDSPEKIKGQINRSLQELGDRAEKGRHATDQNDATNEYQELLSYAASLSQGGEIPKRVLTRIFVYAPTIESLQEKIANLRSQLKGLNYTTAVYMFMQPDQYKSMSEPLSVQQKQFTALSPQSIPSLTLGGGIPFSYQELRDPRGLPLGITTTGGAFIFDQFRSTNSRRSFNMMVLGKMGMGKSTLLKMLTEGSFTRNMFWRGIDKTKEYIELVKALGGTIVSLDGSQGMINPLEVMATTIDPKTGKVDEIASFMQHLSKVGILFRMVNTDFTQIEMEDFTNLLRSFYMQIGLLPQKWNTTDRAKVHITGLSPQSYPTFSDFAKYIDQVATDQYLNSINATADRRRTFEKIKVGLHAMIDNYGQIFDGHSTMKDLTNDKVVLFDSSAISTMASNVYQAQLYMALSLIWNHALINGRRQNALLEEGKIKRRDVAYFNVMLDECHNIINPDNIFAVEYVKNFEREMRKFNAGIIFATQSPEEMVPDNVETAQLSSLKVVFELCQYKIMLGMDPSQLGKIQQLLGNALTSSDYKRIPDLDLGESIITMGAKERYQVSFTPTKEQLELFKGGQ